METADLSHHISRRFNEDLEHVRTRVLAMGGLVEELLGKAISALIEGDSTLGESVSKDDMVVNSMEVAIDEECSRILATRSPAAGDLRLIIAILKTITDLERIGDEAEKIARMAKLVHTAERLYMPRLELKHVANLTLGMLRKSLDAFARLDSSAAAQVVRQDDLVDDEFRSILRQLITFMMEDPRTITRSLEVLFVAKALERIGDHSKNMAEYVVYMVEGRDVRHLRDEPGSRNLLEG
jgi:phosphate transport system protein